MELEFLRVYDLLTVRVSVLDESLMPTYSNIGDAGADLRSRIDATIEPGERMLIPTGLTLLLPPGLAGFVHPRSGLALKHGITVLNTPGTIDSGYRGEVGVILYNTGKEPFEVKKLDRVAQLVIQPYVHASFVNVPNPDSAVLDTFRGNDGFGSTGVG
jgi:dUTP pyrophosphatase